MRGLADRGTGSRHTRRCPTHSPPQSGHKKTAFAVLCTCTVRAAKPDRWTYSGTVKVNPNTQGVNGTVILYLPLVPARLSAVPAIEQPRKPVQKPRCSRFAYVVASWDQPRTMEVKMSNSLAPVSPAHAAALDITLAIIAKSDFVSAGTAGPDAYGKRASDFANAIFNSVLENLQKK